MTIETLHDAIGLLPNDLILETDKKRNRPVKTARWKRIAAMAACIALILYCGLLFRSGLLTGGSKSAPVEMMQQAATPEAPAAQMEENSLAGDPATAAPREEAAAEESPAEAGGADSSLCIDHAHRAAEEAEAEKTTGAYCGNTTATIHIGGESHTIAGSDAIVLTDILRNLDYSADTLCRCIHQFTVDTETQDGYQVNLTEYFVRLNGTQAPLSQSQAEAIQAILDDLPLVIAE